MLDGGNKQRVTINKEYYASTTAAIESVLPISTIYTEEGIYVEIIHITNALIQKIIEDKEYKVIINMRGKLAEITMMKYPQIYCKYITIKKKGENVLYVQALNAMYGIMKAVHLFYKKFFGDLTNIGFKLRYY